MQTVTDRRSSSRHPSRRAGNCVLPTDKECICWPATIHDISTCGIGFMLDCRFEPGTQVSVQVQDATGQHALSRMVEVKHVRRENGNGFIFGGEFVDTLSEEQLRLLV